jgi:hypothetical protein
MLLLVAINIYKCNHLCVNLLSIHRSEHGNPMQHINNVTSFEQAHFDPTQSVVQSHSVDIVGLFGFPLTDLQIIGIAGAPTRSNITVFYQSNWIVAGSEDVPPGLYFRVENPHYIRSKNVIGIFRDGASGFGVYLNSIDFNSGGPKGLAARMLAVIIRCALKISRITRLRLLAAGGRSWPYLDDKTGERWGGFVAWPTYGFDMELLPETLNLAQEFPHYPYDIVSRLKVSDVLKIPGGREYWKIVGDGLYMDFDLSSESTQSIVILDSFLKKVGI